MSRAGVRVRAAAAIVFAVALACADGPSTITIPTPTGTIAGRVLDARTGAPIAGAEISILPFVAGTTTDAEGRFTVADLEVGTEYRVSALKTGYTSSSVEVDLAGHQLFFSVEFTLVRLAP